MGVTINAYRDHDVIACGNTVCLEELGVDHIVIPTANEGTLVGNNQYTVGRLTEIPGEHTFTYDYDDETGARHVNAQWVVLFSEGSGDIRVILFTESIHVLSYNVNDAGKITSLSFGPGNGVAHIASLSTSDTSTDSNGDGVPDFVSDVITMFGNIGNSGEAHGSKNLLTSEGANVLTSTGKQIMVRTS